jgi:predicted RNA-binding Zn-ribbon protein involved in translation (DUF1610 family)
MGDMSVRVTEQTPAETKWLQQIIEMGRTTPRLFKCEGCGLMIEFLLEYQALERRMNYKVACPNCGALNSTGWRANKVRNFGEEQWRDAEPIEDED